jgi:hypothetical protein
MSEDFLGLFHSQPDGIVLHPGQELFRLSFQELRAGAPDEVVKPACGRKARRIRDLATAVVPNDAAHVQHEIRYCKGVQSTGARST